MKVLFTLYKKDCHSLYKQFIQSNDPTITFYTLDDIFTYNIFHYTNNPFKLIFYKLIQNFKIVKFSRRKSIDIIYSCDGNILLMPPIPWVMDMEHVTSLIAHKFFLWFILKPILPLLLKQNKLKYIFPWSLAGKKSIIANLNLSKEVTNKIIPVNLCINKNINPKNISIEKKIIKLLFVTSVNYNNENEFYNKGGKIIIEIIKRLPKNKFHFILRTKIPKEYDYLRHHSNIEIIEDTVEERDIDKIFAKSDIFLYPGYQSPGLAIIEALRNGVPTVCFRIFSNKEMVINKKTGYTIIPDSSINYDSLYKRFKIRGVPSAEQSKYDIPSDKVVDEFVNKIFMLSSNRLRYKKISNNCTNHFIKHYSHNSRMTKINYYLNFIKNETR